MTAPFREARPVASQELKSDRDALTIHAAIEAVRDDTIHVRRRVARVRNVNVVGARPFRTGKVFARRRLAVDRRLLHVRTVGNRDDSVADARAGIRVDNRDIDRVGRARPTARFMRAISEGPDSNDTSRSRTPRGQR